jgi:hypothetical protein
MKDPVYPGIDPEITGFRIILGIAIQLQIGRRIESYPQPEQSLVKITKGQVSDVSYAMKLVCNT